MENTNTNRKKQLFKDTMKSDQKQQKERKRISLIQRREHGWTGSPFILLIPLGKKQWGLLELKSGKATLIGLRY